MLFKIREIGCFHFEDRQWALLPIKTCYHICLKWSLLPNVFGRCANFIIQPPGSVSSFWLYKSLEIFIRKLLVLYKYGTEIATKINPLLMYNAAKIVRKWHTLYRLLRCTVCLFFIPKQYLLNKWFLLG